MASIDWPSDLNDANTGTLQENYAPAYVDDQAQVGASRRRKRFTRTLRTFAFDIVLDDTDRTTFETFIETTTSGGTSSFNWTHPTKDTIYEVRFTDLPQFRDLADGYWTASVRLEEV